MALDLSPAHPAALARALAAPSPVLAAAAAAPRVSARDLLAGRAALIVVAPHPDDETLGAGGLLHEAAAMGVPAKVVCLTDGSASHPGSRLWPPERIARARRAELEAAVAALGSGIEAVWMGGRDGALPEGGAAAEALAARLDAAIAPRALVVSAWARDPHVDHERGAVLVARALGARPDLRALAYPVWGRFALGARPQGVRVLDAGEAARRAKARALACHATQMTRLIDDDPEGFVMSAAHQAHFLDHPEILLAP